MFHAECKTNTKALRQWNAQLVKEIARKQRGYTGVITGERGRK